MTRPPIIGSASSAVPREARAPGVPAEEPESGSRTGATERGGTGSAAPRRRIRRPVLVSLLAGGLLFALCAYCLLLSGLLTASRTASQSGDQQRAITTAEWFQRLSPLERHKGPFNIGTAEAMLQNYDRARPQLERALGLTPVADECAVRQNLAFVHEKEAEAFAQAQNIAQANTSYSAARHILDAAPAECRPEDGEQDRAMDEAGDRIDGAQEDMNAADGEGDASGESSGDGSEDSAGSGETQEDEGQPGGSGDSGDSDQSQEDEGPAGGGETGEQAPEDAKREELQQRSEDSRQRQDEANSRERSTGSAEGRPW